METNKIGREAAVLVIVVFLLGVLLGGVGNHLWGERVWGQRSAPHGRDQLIGQLTDELRLTSDQQKQLTAIVDDTRSQWRALYAPLDSQKEQIRLQGRDRIRAILTPDQRPKFEDFMRRLDERRKKDEAR